MKITLNTDIPVLNEFKAQFGQVLEANRFRLRLGTPSFMRPTQGGTLDPNGTRRGTVNGEPNFTSQAIGPLNGITRALQRGFLCHRAKLPGVNIDHHNIEIGMGFDREMPYHGNSTAPIEVDFYVAGPKNDAMGVLKFFDEWTRYIYRNQESESQAWDIGYYDDFVTSVFIDIFRRDASGVLGTVQLHEAWPKTLTPIDLDWSSTEPMHMNVTFNYHQWDWLDLREPTAFTTPANTDQTTPLTGLIDV